MEGNLSCGIINFCDSENLCVQLFVGHLFGNHIRCRKRACIEGKILFEVKVRAT